MPPNDAIEIHVCYNAKNKEIKGIEKNSSHFCDNVRTDVECRKVSKTGKPKRESDIYENKGLKSLIISVEISFLLCSLQDILIS
jgi:hypothetical protein